VPFTFSHPAVVAPLTFLSKKKFSITALTIGSVTPDFEYFINFKQQSNYSHTWLGIFWFDLPIAIILFYLFNTLVKDELIDSLPGFLNSRFSRFKNLRRIKFPRERYLVLLTSFIMGITSHLCWDKLLHRSVRLVEEPEDFYSVFWDANSVIGAGVIAYMIFRLPKTSVTKGDSFFFWFFTLLTTLIVMIQRNFRPRPLRELEVSLISGFLIGLLVASAFLKIFRKKQPKRG
jgi:MFS family permease